MSAALKPTGEMSPRQRARFVRETKAYLKERDRDQLAQLRRALERAQKRQRLAMDKVIARCKRNRQKVRERVKAYRAAERERINQEVAEMRAAARRHCDLRKEAVRAAGGSLRSRKRGELEAERQLQRELEQTKRHAERRKAKFQRTAREVQSESDDHVRANIDPELLPVFERVKRSIRGGPNKSRTEAFLEYIESNPEDVIALQQQAADVEVKRLLAEQAKAEREAAKRRKRSYKPTKAELAEYLEDVPF